MKKWYLHSFNPDIDFGYDLSTKCFELKEGWYYHAGKDEETVIEGLKIRHCAERSGRLMLLYFDRESKRKDNCDRITVRICFMNVTSIPVRKYEVIPLMCRFSLYISDKKVLTKKDLAVARAMVLSCTRVFPSLEKVDRALLICQKMLEDYPDDPEFLKISKQAWELREILTDKNSWYGRSHPEQFHDDELKN